MKLENQVCTLEQAIKLKGLGLNGHAIFHWIPEAWDDGYRLKFRPNTSKKCFPAYTVAELGVMLGKNVKEIFLHGPTGMWTQKQGMNPNMFITQAECYANWLIHLLENKLITAEEVNTRLQNS